MTNFVRVRLENGSEASIPESHAVMAGLAPLRKPALSRDGSPAPTKHRVKRAESQPTTSTPEASPASESAQEG